MARGLRRRWQLRRKADIVASPGRPLLGCPPYPLSISAPEPQLKVSVRVWLLVVAGSLGAALAAQVAPPPAAAPQETAAPPSSSGEISGRVLLAGSDGKTVPAADAVVWVPDLATREPPAPAGMASKAKSFAPHVVVVPRGGTVVFANLDRIYHNVFSATAGQAFDLGLYRNGASRSHRFEVPGLVTVYCNIHPKMAGYVRVVEGVWCMTDSIGAFRIPDVAAGPHTVHLWHERAGEREVLTQVRPAKTAEVQVTLDASRFRTALHKNKHGQDYPPATLDDDRY
jgi:plastocyanin